MKSRPKLPLLMLLPILLTLPACQHLSTSASLTRMERPQLPTRSPELDKTEHLTPIGKPETGVLRPVDMGFLETVLDRYAEAVVAVTHLNNRIGGSKKADFCVRAIFTTGKPGAGCPTTK